MSTDPYIREIDRIEDDKGRIVVVGVNRGTVTLRTLGTRTGGAVELSTEKTEELAQLIVSATWQAAWQVAMDLGRAGAVPATSPGEPPW